MRSAKRKSRGIHVGHPQHREEKKRKEIQKHCLLSLVPFLKIPCVGMDCVCANGTCSRCRVREVVSIFRQVIKATAKHSVPDDTAFLFGPLKNCLERAKRRERMVHEVRNDGERVIWVSMPVSVVHAVTSELLLPRTDICCQALLTFAALHPTHPNCIRILLNSLLARWKEGWPDVLIRSEHLGDPEQDFRERRRTLKKRRLTYPAPFDADVQTAQFTFDKEFVVADANNFVYVPIRRRKKELRILVHSLVLAYPSAVLDQLERVLAQDKQWTATVPQVLTGFMSATAAWRLCATIEARKKVKIEFVREDYCVHFAARAAGISKAPDDLSVQGIPKNCLVCRTSPVRICCDHCKRPRTCSTSCMQLDWNARHRHQCPSRQEEQKDGPQIGSPVLVQVFVD